MTQSRDSNGHFETKAVLPLTPTQAKIAASSPLRLREETLRINKALARGVKRIQLGTLDEGLADQLVAAFVSAGWRASSYWLKQRIYMSLSERSK